MRKEREEALHEQEARLGAMLAQLQMDKAKEVTIMRHTNTNTNTNTFILEIYTYIHEIFWKYIHDMAMKIKFMMYAPGNRNYGYCRLHFGYQIMIYIYKYIYITSLIETSRLMLIKIK